MIKEIEINLLPEDLVNQEVIKRAIAKKLHKQSNQNEQTELN